MKEYLEKSLSCFSNGNRKGDKSDEIKKWLAREEVGQVKAGKVFGKICKVVTLEDSKLEIRTDSRKCFFLPSPTLCKKAHYQQPWRKELSCQNKDDQRGKIIKVVASPVGIIDLHQHVAFWIN